MRNRQEMLALMGYLGNRAKFNEIATKTRSAHAEGIGEKDIAVMQDTDSFKAERAKSLGEIGEMDAMRGFNKVIGNASDKVTEYATKYPGLISAIMGTKVAFEGLTTVLMTIGLMRFVTGHGGGAAARAAEHLAARGGGAAAREVAQLAGRAATRVPLLARAAQAAGPLARFLKPAGSSALSLLFGGMEAYGISQDASLSAQQKKSEYSRVAGGTVGGIGGWMAGAAAGAAVGSVVPLIGTAVGGVVGGLAGGLGGDMLGEKLGKWIGDALFKAESQKQVAPTTIKTQVVIDGHVLAEAVNQVNTAAARRS